MIADSAAHNLFVADEIRQGGAGGFAFLLQAYDWGVFPFMVLRLDFRFLIEYDGFPVLLGGFCQALGAVLYIDFSEAVAIVHGRHLSLCLILYQIA